MCRYAFHDYKQHYACFDCRKAFKHHGRSSSEQVLSQRGKRSYWHWQPVTPRCPECRQDMHAMGLDFKAPGKHDRKQWLKVERLFHAGFAFHSCGCGGPGARPRLLNEVPAFLEANRHESAGQAFLRRVSKRRASRA